MSGYGTDIGLTDYAAARGVTVDPGANLAAARLAGSLYVDSTFVGRFSGEPTGGAAQERQWPRTDATDRYGNSLADDTVPTAVLNGAYEAAMIELGSPGSLFVTTAPGRRVKREKVGGLEVEYEVTAYSDVSRDVAVSSQVVAALLPILRSQTGPAVLVV